MMIYTLAAFLSFRVEFHRKTMMSRLPIHTRLARPLAGLLVLLGALLACSRSNQAGGSDYFSASGLGTDSPAAGVEMSITTPGAQGFKMPPTRLPGAPILTPTPDAPHAVPTLRTEAMQYIVRSQDTLGEIARRYGVTLEELIAANKLDNPNLLAPGQELTIPVPRPRGDSPGVKIIPDSELVYGPASIGFDIAGFIAQKGGYLARYTEDIDDQTYTGAQIVKRVAEDYSVNPRLLLAVLQYQSKWVTRADPNPITLDYPMDVREQLRKGLYHQLAWAANNLNRGFYLWRVNGAATWVLGDGSTVLVNPEINAGTAGVQAMFAPLYDLEGWQEAIAPDGFLAVYTSLFGYPFDLAVEPLLPPDLRQPKLSLPFVEGRVWSFTGGPHAGWDSGSAWAALDFAPPGEALGCIKSDEWVVASADGVIVRANDGAVVEDLDGDGYEQTGWTILYMHIGTQGRVKPGSYVKAGDRIGHPSCEGGYSTGTHLHLARRYNGEWIPADQTLPFVLDGWVSRGGGNEYDGFLEKKGHEIEAWKGRSSDNAIQR
jgi:LasA protease